MKKFASVVLYGCGISLFASSCVQKAEEKKLNVLFIMTDQQRYDMLSCAGNRYVSTPSLDRLAENGVRFEHNYCANPVSMPSRFAMVTGRYAGEIGYTNNSTKPDTLRVLPVARESSVGNLFRNAGYQIRAFIVEGLTWRSMVLPRMVRIITRVLPILPRTFLLAIIRLRMNLFSYISLS